MAFAHHGDVGLLAMAMLFVRTPNQFYVMRFLLGAAEAGFFPGVVFYLTEWFPPEYRARTISRFYIALPLSSTVMGTLAGSLLGLNGRFGLAGWQWLFLLEGLPALVMSVVFLNLLPDRPADAGWLTTAEREWLEQRHRLAAAEAPTGATAGEHGWADFKQAVRLPQLWMLGFAALAQLTVNYAWGFSAPEIVTRLTGLGVGPVGNLIAAMGLLGAAAMIVNALHSDRSGERTWHVVGSYLVMGARLCGGSDDCEPVDRAAGVRDCADGVQRGAGPFLAMPSMLLSGRASAIGYAIYNAIAIGGGFLGPYWMGRAKDWTGGYERGLMALALPSFAAAGLILWFGRSLKRSRSA